MINSIDFGSLGIIIIVIFVIILHPFMTYSYYNPVHSILSVIISFSMKTSLQYAVFTSLIYSIVFDKIQSIVEIQSIQYYTTGKGRENREISRFFL